MPNISTRRDWFGFAVVAILAVAAGFAYQLSLPPFSPTPRQARAALAETGMCKPDAKIERREGMLFIGPVECDLPKRECQVRSGANFRVNLFYSWELSLSAPLGQWAATHPVAGNSST